MSSFDKSRISVDKKQGRRIKGAANTTSAPVIELNRRAHVLVMENTGKRAGGSCMHTIIKFAFKVRVSRDI